MPAGGNSRHSSWVGRKVRRQEELEVRNGDREFSVDSPEICRHCYAVDSAFVGELFHLHFQRSVIRRWRGIIIDSTRFEERGTFL